MRKFVYSTLIFLLFMALALRYFLAPWIWICLVGAAILFVITYLSKNQQAKFISLNIGVIILTVGLFEAYLWGDTAITPLLYPAHGLEFIGGTAYFNDNLKLEPNLSMLAIRHHKNDLVFKVQYTTNEHGLRSMPVVDADVPCILFFGGSYTFGDGVADSETLPYRVAVKTDGAYQVHNFGLSGFGPHQVLYTIEQGFVEQVVGNCDTRYIIYQAIPSHVIRAAGIPDFSWGTPKYILSEAGQPVQVGFYPTLEDLPLPQRMAQQHFNKSRTYQNLFGTRRSPTEQELQLFIALVKQSQQLLTERYPNATFHMLMWRSSVPMWDSAGEVLANESIQIHKVEDILTPAPNKTWAESFQLVGDGHPNATAYDEIATYFVNTVIAP